jgi:hypothetical protein
MKMITRYASAESMIRNGNVTFYRSITHNYLPFSILTCSSSSLEGKYKMSQSMRRKFQ